MLTKLFKYEFKSTSRLFLPIYALLLAYTVICKLTNILSERLDIMTLPNVLVMALYALLMLFVAALTFIMTIQRFYKNLITDEGYLSFTLPVEPYKHMIVKLTTSIVWILASVVTCAFSLFILAYHQGLIKEITDMVDMVINQLSAVSDVPLPVLAVEGVILLLISLAVNILMIYAAMALGQLFTGHKIAGSLVSYLGLYMAVQILMTVILVTISVTNPEWWNMFTKTPPRIGYEYFHDFNDVRIFYLRLCVFPYNKLRVYQKAEP